MVNDKLILMSYYECVLMFYSNGSTVKYGNHVIFVYIQNMYVQIVTEIHQRVKLGGKKTNLIKPIK